MVTSDQVTWFVAYCFKAVLVVVVLLGFLGGLEVSANFT